MESGLPRFRPGFTCPALLRCQSNQRLLSPTGLSPCFAQLSRCVWLAFADHYDWSYNPEESLFGLGFHPISLAATMGISFDFFSSAYLDVSVLQVSPRTPIYSVCDDGVLAPPGCPIRKPSDHRFFQLPEAYRRYLRPSSPVDA